MKCTSLILISLVPLLVGCASVGAHTDFMSCQTGNPRAHMATPIFPGTVTDVGMTGVALASPISCAFTDHPPWLFFATPLFLIDLPLSFAADVVYFPWDIAYWAKH